MAPATSIEVWEAKEKEKQSRERPDAEARAMGSQVHSHHVPHLHTLQVALKFPFDATHNASASKPVFMLHEGATTIVDYLHRQWGERWVAGIFFRVVVGTRRRCGEKPPLVVDIGANAGYYAMLSGALGARVALFDAQPACWEFAERAIASSHLSSRMQLVRGGVSTREHNTHIDVSHVQQGEACSGHFGQRGRADIIQSPAPLAGAGASAGASAGARRWTEAFALGRFRDGMLGKALSEGGAITLLKVDVEVCREEGLQHCSRGSSS